MEKQILEVVLNIQSTQFNMQKQLDTILQDIKILKEQRRIDSINISKILEAQSFYV